MASRAATCPSRPQIRISSTFFWHLSSDYDLAPLPGLGEKARKHGRVSGDQQSLHDDLDVVVYHNMKVGHQVQRYAVRSVSCKLPMDAYSIAHDVNAYLSMFSTSSSELKHIALMA